MAQRRIVPDNSVMLPAYFAEELIHRGSRFDLTRRAKPIADHIRAATVQAFAPELLRHEFITRAREKASSRSAPAVVDLEVAFRQIEDFLSLPIIYARGGHIVDLALDLMRTTGISTADSWYLACAIHHDAELWISHEHSDHLVEIARRSHDKVYVLTERAFA